MSRTVDRNNSKSIVSTTRISPGFKLPPIKDKKRRSPRTSALSPEVSYVTCPTEYLRRLRGKKSTLPDPECSQWTQCQSEDKELSKSCKLVIHTQHLQGESTSEAGLRKIISNCLQGQNECIAMSKTEPSFSSPGSYNLQQTQSNVFSAEDTPSTEQLCTMTETENTASESFGGSGWSKYPQEETEDGSHRDRYVAAMEELFKRYKELTGRSARGAQGLVTTSAMPVPGRRIQPLTVYPEDPLKKFTGRHIQHSLGFKLPEKDDSLVVEPDYEILREVNVLQECEKKLLSIASKSGNKSRSQPTELIRSLTNLLRERSLSLHASTNPLTESHRPNESSVDLKTLSSSDFYQGENDQSVWIDKTQMPLYFNPVLQIYPDQKPWRAQNKETDKIPKGDEESMIGSILDKIGNVTELAMKGKRPRSASDLTRSPEMEFELSNAFNLVFKNRSSSSSAIITGTFTDADTTLFRTISKTKSFSEVHHSSSVDSSILSEDRGQLIRPNPSMDEEILQNTEKYCSKGSSADHVNRGDQIIFPSSASDLSQVPISNENETSHVHPDYPIKTSAPKSIQANPLDRIAGPRYTVKRQLEGLRGNIPSHCLDMYLASIDPNPMAWFDVLDSRLANQINRSTIREKLIDQFRMKGLCRRFTQIPNGLLGLQNELKKGWEIRPKAELLMKCVVKNHVLKMPLLLPHAELIHEIYMNTIVRHPGLYKLLLRRREILPQELQHFINRIMEMTETSDRMMASITNSTTKLAAITTAAKEMDASGFMCGGPKFDGLKPRPQQTTEEAGEVDLANDAETPQKRKVSVASHAISLYKKEKAFLTSYSKETDFDKGFYTSLRNPSSNILEEISLIIPEFAWHVRPLYEHLWSTLEDDLYGKLLATHLNESEGIDCGVLHRENTIELFNGRNSIGSIEMAPPKEELLEWPETLEFCLNLFNRILVYFGTHSVVSPGDGILRDLLICLHMCNYYTKLSTCIVNELDSWIPHLLNGLESKYASIREETCCVLSYLVCAYRLISKLHSVSKNLLLANITLSVLSAIGHYPESYAFYHGLLGYMLHALPCLSVLDCLLLWLPVVETQPNNLVARDWALFVYYVLRHWPRTPFYLDGIYQKRLLKPLENSFLNKNAKRSARLALSYLVRTCGLKSALLTCWPEVEENK